MGRTFNSPRLQTGEPSRKKISIAPSGQEGAAPMGLIKLNLISNPSLKPGAIDITFLGNGLNTCTVSSMAAHLGTCEKCRGQMRSIQFGKTLDEHLVDE
jgi:hypothetical protein